MMNTHSDKEKGIALVSSSIVTLLLSLLTATMLFSSTNDVLISGNDIRTNQAFYIAEAGLNRATGWFTARFGTDPSLGQYLLPEYTTASQPGVLIYTTPLSYQKGANTTDAEQTIPTCVKVRVGSNLQNVVLAGDSSDTYPTSYTVTADNGSGASTTYTFSNVVKNFTDNLSGQTEGEGQFTVKATLISMIPPSAQQPQGNIIWLLKSTARITRSGDKTIASATLWGYISAPLTPVKKTVTGQTGTETSDLPPGLAARSMVALTGTIRVDSYKSSKGVYAKSMPANSYPGQIGAANIASRGDLRTNNETFAIVPGFINVPLGTVTGGAYAALPAPAVGLLGGLPLFDPIAINPLLGLVSNGRGGTFSASDKHYSQPQITFPAVPDPPAPPPGSPDYTHIGATPATLPPGNYNNVTVASLAALTIPPGSYGILNVIESGKVYLGVPGQRTVYNFQQVLLTGAARMVFRGPVTVNVANNMLMSGIVSVSDPSTPPSAIRWNFKGGALQVVAVTLVGDMLGVLYAPNNDVAISGVGNYYGSVVGRNILVSAVVGVHIDEDGTSGAQTTGTTSTSIVGYTANNYSLWRITQQLD